MNIFLKSQIKTSLDRKVKNEEIRSYQLTETTLHIRKSKRAKHTIDLVGLPANVIVRLLSKKIPDPGVMNTGEFFKREIRNLKLNELL